MTATPLTAIADILAPSRTALLVIDVQNDFIHPEGWSARHAPDAPSLRHVIPVINTLIAAARRAGIVVVYVVMEHGPGIDAPNYQARYVARGMADDILCRQGTWGAELDAEVTAPRPEDIVIRRPSYDGFARTELDRLLRQQGVETCVATGVVTNLCVQTTIQHAFSLGYYVALASDGTAAASMLEHDVALDSFRRFFGPVMTGRDIAALWTAAPAAPATKG
jgi:ureidoacrylate peracid hydrolase